MPSIPPKDLITIFDGFRVKKYINQLVNFVLDKKPLRIPFVLRLWYESSNNKISLVKPGIDYIIGSGGFSRSQFQPYTLPPHIVGIFHDKGGRKVRPPLQEELALNKILASPILTNILKDDYLNFQRTGQVSRSWCVVRDLCERCRTTAINIETSEWDGETIVVSDSDSQTDIGSEFDLDLIVSQGGGKPSSPWIVVLLLFKGRKKKIPRSTIRYFTWIHKQCF